MKRQPSEWEKIIANEATDKQLISRIYENQVFNVMLQIAIVVLNVERSYKSNKRNLVQKTRACITWLL